MNFSPIDPCLQSVVVKCCTVCGITTGLYSCAQCNSAYYCSRAHQQIDWQIHQFVCKAQHRQQQPVQQPIQSVPNLPSIYISDPSIMANNIGIAAPEQLDPNNNSGLMINQQMNSTGQQSRQHPNNDMNALQALNSLVDTNHNLIFKQNSIQSKLDTYCETIVKDMNEYGFCVIDNFLENGPDILAEVYQLYNCGFFKPGQVVNNEAAIQHLIRSDQIVWVYGNEMMCSNIGFLMHTFDSIVVRCNKWQRDGVFAQYRINSRTKAMVACYPGNNSEYKLHVDNPNNDGRRITCIYYLNKDYNRERDGGVLRIFPQSSSNIADIEPLFNRALFFWSDRRNPHEVRPSNRMRFAITVWYYDSNEREMHRNKYRQQNIQ